MKQKRFVSRVVSLIFLMSVLSMGNLFAQKAPKESPASDFKYDLNEAGDGVVITEYLGKGGDVVIPSKIEDMPVVEVKMSTLFGMDDYALLFSSKDERVNSVIFPDSVMKITVDFRDNSRLKKVVFPKHIKKIPQYVCRDCKNLTEIILPESLEIISSQAFSNTALKSVNLPKTLKEIEGSAFSNTKLSSITFPEGLEVIGSGAFDNTNFKTLVFPKSVKRIGGGAFSECKNLVTVTIGDNIEEIDSEAFANTVFLH